MQSIVEKISTQIRETHEEFIYQAINPYCQEIIECKLTKEELKERLQGYERGYKKGYLQGASDKGEFNKHTIEALHDGVSEESFKAAVTWCRQIIKDFAKEWNNQSNKRIPYKAIEELDEYIMQQDQKRGQK